MKLIDRLPKSYSDIKFTTYVKILQAIPGEKPEDLTASEWATELNMATLSILLGVTTTEIETLKAVEVYELMKCISFLDVAPNRSKIPYRVKGLDDLTFDEFAAYQRLRLDQWNEMETILSIVIKDVSREQIGSLTVPEVMEVFFCLKKQTRKFLTPLKYSLLWRIATKRMRTKIGRLMFWTRSEN